VGLQIKIKYKYYQQEINIKIIRILLSMEIYSNINKVKILLIKLVIFFTKNKILFFLFILLSSFIIIIATLQHGARNKLKLA
jgi:hypothetical protein